MKTWKRQDANGYNGVSITPSGGGRPTVQVTGCDTATRLSTILQPDELPAVIDTLQSYLPPAEVATDPIGYANTYEDGSVAYFDTVEEAKEYGEFRNTLRVAVPMYLTPQPAEQPVPEPEPTDNTPFKPQDFQPEICKWLQDHGIKEVPFNMPVAPKKTLTMDDVVPSPLGYSFSSPLVGRKNVINTPTDTPETVALLKAIDNAATDIAVLAMEYGVAKQDSTEEGTYDRALDAAVATFNAALGKLRACLGATK